MRFWFVFLGFRNGCRRAGITGESRDTCPAKWPSSVRSTEAPRNLRPNAPAAKPATFREKVASTLTLSPIYSHSTGVLDGGHSVLSVSPVAFLYSQRMRPFSEMHRFR